MEILEELPLEQWPILQEKLKGLWPLNVPGYYTLHANMKYPRLREHFKFKVYCPYGNMDHGFVAINTKDHPEVIMFSTTEDTSVIEEAVIKTKLIDWSEAVMFDIVSSIILRALRRVNEVLQFESFEVWDATMFHLPGNVKPFSPSRPPDNTYLTSVKPENIHQVNDTWPYKHSQSYNYFTLLASNGLSYGLYSSDTNELMAWIFINDFNFLCHLYCEEKYRKRGYGEYVMQCAVNGLLKDGHDVYAYVVPGNEKPLPLFSKLGFKHVDDAAFLCVEKNKKATNKH